MTSTLTSTSSPPDNNNELDAAFTQVALSKVRLDSIRVRQRDHAAEADNLEKMAKEEVRKAKSHQASLLNLASSLAEGLRERRADLAAFLREQKVELEAMGARRKTELKELDELHRFAIDKMAKIFTEENQILEVSIREDEIKMKEVENLLKYLSMVEWARPRTRGHDKHHDLEVTADEKGMDELLECPVCLVSYTKTRNDSGQLIFQCQRGHTMCGECKGKVICCPVCRENFAVLSPARCLLLEQIISRLSVKKQSK